MIVKNKLLKSVTLSVYALADASIPFGKLADNLSLTKQKNNILRYFKNRLNYSIDLAEDILFDTITLHNRTVASSTTMLFIDGHSLLQIMVQYKLVDENGYPIKLVK